MVKTIEDQLSDANDIIRQKNARLLMIEKELKRRSAARDSAEKIRVEIYKLDEVSPEPPTWLLKDHSKHTTGVPIIPLGDWHWGEVVDPDQVGGKNKFNRTVAKQRVRNLNEAVIDLCFNHMTNPVYPGAVIPIIGDMITGNIHDDLRETNDGPVQLSCIEVEENIIGLLRSWADKFGRLYVPCVPGNHGRNTIKPRVKNAVYESYEWNIYQHIERYFRNDKRVVVHVPNDIDTHFSVFHHRFMLTHGDRIGAKGGDGIIGAIGPIARGTAKVGRAEATIGNDFDTLIMGHYHIYWPRGDAAAVMVNPALIGFNEYAKAILRVPYARAAQSLAFIHPKHGFTAQWPIYVDGERQSANNTPWCDMWEQRK